MTAKGVHVDRIPYCVGPFMGLLKIIFGVSTVDMISNVGVQVPVKSNFVDGYGYLRRRKMSCASMRLAFLFSMVVGGKSISVDVQFRVER